MTQAASKMTATSALPKITEADAKLLFTEARTHNGWQDKPVDEATLQGLYDLLKWGPTATNSCPMRIVFVQSQEAKEKLKPCLMPANQEKTMQAPVTAIICYDLKFFEKLDFLSPANKARTWYEGEGKEEMIQTTAFRNGTLQGAYFIIAARAMGLDCGPMSGFNNDKVDAAFLAGTSWKSNFICSLGYGESSKLYPRAQRLDFADACKIA